MPTLIVRPDALTSSTGFNLSGGSLLEVINDNAAGTTTTQNSTTSHIHVTFANDSTYTGNTINSIVVSITGKAGRAGASTVDIVLYAADESVLDETSLVFGGSTSTQTGNTITVNAEDAALTSTIVDGMFLNITPNNQGITIFEVFATIDYTVVASGYDTAEKINGILISNTEKIIGTTIANIEKVSGL